MNATLTLSPAAKPGITECSVHPVGAAATAAPTESPSGLAPAAGATRSRCPCSLASICGVKT